MWYLKQQASMICWGMHGLVGIYQTHHNLLFINSLIESEWVLFIELYELKAQSALCNREK